MVFFTSRAKVKKLHILKRLWMTPVAYALKYMAGTVMYLGEKFDTKVAFEILLNTRTAGAKA